MRCTSALAMLASRGYVFPLNETETTRNSMTTLSFMFSLRLRFVTVRLTVAPAGIATPFEPLTASVVVAVALLPAEAIHGSDRGNTTTTPSTPSTTTTPLPSSVLLKYTTHLTHI